MSFPYIEIVGTMGSSKTTIIDFFAKNGFAIVPDTFAELDSYKVPHSNLKNRDLALEMAHLDLRAARLDLALPLRGTRVLFGDGGQSLMSPHAIRAHERGLIVGADWDHYLERYGQVVAGWSAPDILVHLQCSSESIRQRIISRMRPSESDWTTPQLVQDLNRINTSLVAGFAQAHPKTPVLHVDTESRDFRNDAEALSLLKELERISRETALPFSLEGDHSKSRLR